MPDTLTLAPGAPAAVTESPFRRLWREHEAAEAEFNERRPEDGRSRALFDRVMRLEREAAALRPRTMEDLAWLVLFADDHGNFDGCGPCADALLAFARDVTGEGVQA